jgi:hypothetical protein
VTTVVTTADVTAAQGQNRSADRPANNEIPEPLSAAGDGPQLAGAGQAIVALRLSLPALR